MPIYEYLCSNCGETFERLILGQAAPVACPHCDGASVEKQFSTFSFRGERGIAPAGGG
jgi:putative FmdB family regulatory protein